MMTAVQRIRPRKRPPLKPYLPAAPLADAVDRLAARDGLGTVCARAGIPERNVTRWRAGESGGRVDLGLADQVMTALGLFWWEVWTEDTVREPLFVVTTYSHYLKKDADRGYRLRRIKVRTIPYGDLGTDFYRLREIAALMGGSMAAAA